MILLLCGGEDYDCTRTDAAWLTAWHGLYGFTELVCGAHRRADRWARLWAMQQHLPVQVLYAARQRHGPAAGALPIGAMVHYCRQRSTRTMALVFPGGPETDACTKACTAAGFSLMRVPVMDFAIGDRVRYVSPHYVGPRHRDDPTATYWVCRKVTTERHWAPPVVFYTIARDDDPDAIDPICCIRADQLANLSPDSTP